MVEHHNPHTPGRYVSGVVMAISVWVGLFIVAGRWTWVQGWAFLIFQVIYLNALSLWLARANPELLAERRRIAPNIQTWDKLIVRLHILSLLSILFVAALDSGRYAWSYLPTSVQIAGWTGVVASAAMIWHVMAVNQFASGWVRIQDDCNHAVVSRGAYRFVRHPMYVAVILLGFSLPLALSSWWALLAGLLEAVVIMVRTALEDRLLLRELHGYGDYAMSVRYRLFPGLW